MSTRRVLWIIAMIMSMHIFSGCNRDIWDNNDDNTDPDVPGDVQSLTFLASQHNPEPGLNSPFDCSLCKIIWEEGNAPVVTKIEGVYIDEDNTMYSSQGGGRIFVYSSSGKMKEEHPEYAKHGDIPIVIDVESMTWSIPEIDVAGVESYYYYRSWSDSETSHPGIMNSDGTTIYFAIEELDEDDEWNGDAHLIKYDVASQQSDFVTGALDLPGVVPGHLHDDDEYGNRIEIFSISPDGKYLVGHVTNWEKYGYTGWSNVGGGSPVLFLYNTISGEFTKITAYQGENDAPWPTFNTISYDSKTIYFSEDDTQYKYDISTGNITMVDESFAKLSNPYPNYAKISNDGRLAGVWDDYAVLYKIVGDKVERVGWDNLASYLWLDRTNSLQFNKARTKVCVLSDDDVDFQLRKRYYIELQSIESDAEVDTLFTLPNYITDLIQIW